MAGWSLFDGGFLVKDSGDVVGVSYDKARRCFEGFIVRFSREICAPNYFWSFPPMLGDGRHVDLYKLFLVAKGKGGYDAVCNGNLWDLVGEESGLGVSVGSSVKLVYSKYLSAVDAWLKKVGESKVPTECGLVDDRDRFRRCLMELHDEVKGFLSDGAEDEVVGDEFKGGFDDDYVDGRKLCGVNAVRGFGLDSDGDEQVPNGECPVSDMPDCEMNDLVLGNMGEGNDAMEVAVGFDEGKISAEDESDAANNSTPGLLIGGNRCDNNDDNGLVLGTSGGDSDNDSSGSNRNRELMLNLLSWVTGIAQNPCDPEVGLMPDKSKWKAYSNQEVWKQVLLFRETAFLKRFESSSEQQSWQSQKMHPYMYDDHLGAAYNLRERLKRDNKLLYGKPTSSVRSSSDSSLGTEGYLDRTPSPHTERLLDFSDSHSGLDSSPTVRVPLGANHQADVPEWTGMTFESDAEWLGTRIWPSRTVNSRLLIERDPIGKGRQDSCGCSVPGSVECVRFHIREKKAKVKLELGAAFYEWSFDKVGEDVRQLWTEEEEKKFEDVVGSNPPSPETYFWDHVFRAFPNKSRADLVSYYFNVFLLQRRGYQNRHTPYKIDSDDDGSEYGPLRNVFGNQTQNARSSILLTPKKSHTKER